MPLRPVTAKNQEEWRRGGHIVQMAAFGPPPPPLVFPQLLCQMYMIAKDLYAV